MFNMLKVFGILPDPGRFTFGWIPLAIMAASAIAGKIKKGKDARDAANSSRDANAENEANRIANAKLGHADKERERIGRVGGVQDQLAGSKYALSPELLENLMTTRAFTDSEQVEPEVTGSVLGDAAGGAIEQVGKGASAYMQGQGASPGGQFGDDAGAGEIPQSSLDFLTQESVAGPNNLPRRPGRG